MFGSTGSRISLYLIVAWFASGFLGLFQAHITKGFNVGHVTAALILAILSGLSLAVVVNSAKTIVKIVLEPVLLVGVVLTGVGCYRAGGSWWGLVVGGVLLAVYGGILADERDKRKEAIATERMNLANRAANAAKAAGATREEIQAAYQSVWTAK